MSREQRKSLVSGIGFRLIRCLAFLCGLINLSKSCNWPIILAVHNIIIIKYAIGWYLASMVNITPKRILAHKENARVGHRFERASWCLPNITTSYDALVSPGVKRFRNWYNTENKCTCLSFRNFSKLSWSIGFLLHDA